MPHNPLNSKTLSAPNPISTVYKKLLFFDESSNSIRFTNSSTLADMEVVEIANPLNITGNLIVGGELSGTSVSTTSIIKGDVAQLFSDIYSGLSQSVDAVDYTASVSSTVFGDAEGNGLIKTLFNVNTNSISRDEALQENQDNIEKFLVGQSWASGNYNHGSGGSLFTDWTFNDLVGSSYYLDTSTHLSDALGKVDTQLKKHNQFILSILNELQGTEGDVTPPSAPGLATVNYTSDLWTIGDGTTPNTHYLISKHDVAQTPASDLLARPDGTTNDVALRSLSSRNAFLELDKELNRNEVWTHKINKYLTGDDLNAESDSGGAFAFSQDTTQWSGLSNLPSDGTYMRPWNEFTQAPTGIVPNNLKQALHNMDSNMRMIKHRADINYRSTGSNLGLMADNPNRRNLQDLRQDVNLMAVELGSAADSTNSFAFNYAEPTMNYPHSGTRTLMADILKLDDNLGNMQTMVAGAISNGVDNYSTDVPGTSTVKDNINWIHDEGWSNANSLSNRLVKVVDASSNIVFTENIDIDSTKFMRYPKGQDFAGNEPYGGTTDWGQYVVNKNYVDGVTNGLIYRPNVDCVAASNITLSGASQTLDGVAATAGKRVLCIGQSTAADNGVYVAAAGAWARASDFASGTALRTWTYWVAGGTVYGNRHMNVGGDNTTYTIGSSDIDGWVSIWKTFGLQGGIGTSPDTDRIDINTGKSLYTDGTDGSTLNVAIAGSSGSQTGNPHDQAWSAGVRSNSGNPIAYLDGTGSGAGLTLKYGSDFALSGSGDLKLADAQASMTTWSYEISKYAESANDGENSGGGDTATFWDAAAWALLRELVGNADRQVAELASDGRPKFDALGIGALADTDEPAGDGYRLWVEDNTNEARIGIQCTIDDDAALAFWTGAGTQTLKGGVGYDHSDSLIKLWHGSGMYDNYDLCINTSGNVGIGGIPETDVSLNVESSTMRQLRLERITTDADSWEMGASSGGLYFWEGAVDAEATAEILFKNTGQISVLDSLSVGVPHADAPDASSYKIVAKATAGEPGYLVVEADDDESRGVLFRNPSNVTGFIGHYNTATVDLISLTKDSGAASDKGLHIDEYGSIGFGTRVPTRNANNDASSSYWQFGRNSRAANYPAGDEPNKFLQVCSDVPDDIVGVGLYVDDFSTDPSHTLKRAGWFLSDKTNECWWHRTYHSGEPTYAYQWRCGNRGDIMRIKPTGGLDLIGPSPYLHLGDNDAADASATGGYISMGDEAGNAWSKIGHFEADKHLYIELDPNNTYTNTAFKVKGGDGEILRVSEYHNGTVAINSTGGDSADNADLTVHGQGSKHASISLNTWKNTGVDSNIGNTRSIIDIESARGTQGSPAILADEDFIGQICFNGYTGNASHGGNYAVGASIRAFVDGTPDAVTENNLPTKLQFRTCYGGGHHDVMQIYPNGGIQIGDTSGSAETDGLHIKKTSYWAQLRLERLSNGTHDGKTDIGAGNVSSDGSGLDVLNFYVGGYPSLTHQFYSNGNATFTGDTTTQGTLYASGDMRLTGDILDSGGTAIYDKTNDAFKIKTIYHGVSPTDGGYVGFQTAVGGSAQKILTRGLVATTGNFTNHDGTDDKWKDGGLYTTGECYSEGNITTEGVLRVRDSDTAGANGIGIRGTDDNTGIRFDSQTAANNHGHICFDIDSAQKFIIDQTSADFGTHITTTSANNITAGGNLIFGDAYGLKGGAHVLIDSGNNFFGNNGNFEGDVVSNYSDERLKDISGKIDSPLDKVSQLNGFYYTPNDEAIKLGVEADKAEVGVSAQEVAAIMPEAVAKSPIKSPTEEYLTVRYERLVPLLIESIKELKAEIEELKKGK